MNELPSAAPPRSVRPRKPRPDTRPVIAVSNDLVVVESMGDEVFGADELGKVLSAHVPAIIVCQSFGRHLERLEREYRDDPAFNYRITPLKRYHRTWNDGRKLDQGYIIDAICNFVGWKSEGHGANRYHYPLDPIWFLTTGIDELDDRQGIPRIVKLYEWGKQVRDWCLESGLTVKASAGGIAAQLLRDSRFYPNPRRKAPKLINDVCRYQLPGNYYRLHADTGRYYRALHLDMENAHHSVARYLTFPDVDSLHAYGYWAADSPNLDEGERRPRKPYAPGDAPILESPGIFHVRISSPHIRRDFFPPPFMERGGETDCFLYSNELELVKRLGGQILHIYAAYCSHGQEQGLNRYAEFAIQQIRKYPGYKPWLKPTLHATYGLLAARPVAFETGYYRAQGGRFTEYHMGKWSFPAFAKERTREVESAIANVIHRGIIEAEVRKRTLELAATLTQAYGYEVLAIYADALFVRDNGRQLPLLEPPWRLSKTLSSLKFHSSTHFTSPGYSRLPGVPKTARESFLRQSEIVRDITNRPKRSKPDLAAIRNRARVSRSMRDGELCRPSGLVDFRL